LHGELVLVVAHEHERLLAELREVVDRPSRQVDLDCFAVEVPANGRLFARANTAYDQAVALASSDLARARFVLSRVRALLNVGELSDAAAALDWMQALNPEAKSCWT